MISASTPENLQVMSSTEDDDLDVHTSHHKKLVSNASFKEITSRTLDAVSLASSTADEATDLEIYGSKEPARKRLKSEDQDNKRIEWHDKHGEDVGAAAYKKFKTKKPDARKRAAAATRKAKAAQAQQEAKAAAGYTGVGVQEKKKKSRSRRVATFGDVSSDEEFMEWKMPDYVQQRRANFDELVTKLREGGLLLPPEYHEVYFSDDEDLEHLKERPDFPDAKPQGSYKDIELPYSRGLIPASIAQHLRDYQVKGTAFLHEMFVYQRGGILGDDMGLGKTVQVISFLTAAYGKTGDERDAKRMRKMRRSKRWYPRTLVICPGSLMANWQDEFRRWGWWYVDLFHGPNKEEVLQAASAGMIEVMITTYTTYQKHRGEINMVKWDCVVADECHVIKNRRAEITIAMNEVNALCRIGLTGTAIQNKYEELWTLLNWTSPGQLGPLTTWRTSVSEPLKMGQSHNATVYELARARKTAKKLVQNLLPRFFLRRMKTLIKDQLPKKTDRVVFCPLTPVQADAYQNFVESDIVRRIKESSEVCDCGKGKKKGWCCYALHEDGSPWQAWVFPALATLQKLSNHLALLIPAGNDTKDKQARDLDILQIAIPDRWKQLYATRDNILNNSNPEFCGKWRILKKLLRFWHEQGENKVLIFSHSVRLLRMLHDLFMNSSYNVKYLDGSMSYEERYAAVQDFNSDPTQFVFLISTRAGGIGLNITSANKVVVVDPNWNPSYDLQAQDRAYRIGQTRDVEVFRLVSQGTLEEIVYARQIYKQQQANIGYNATEERRYFQGVQDRKDQKGEIFGLQNLFAYQHENVVLRDIVNKTNVAESRADIRVANLELQQDEDGNTDAKGEGDGDEDTERRNVKVEEDREDAAMSQLAAEIKGENPAKPSKAKAKSTNSSALQSTSFLSTTSSNDARSIAPRHDPVQAILFNAGVTYTHENSEVIGTSRVETHLSKRAEEASDTVQQMNKVFVDDSQSHAPSRLTSSKPHPGQDQHQRDIPYDHTLDRNPYNNNAHLSHNKLDVASASVRVAGIRYVYKPPTPVKQRQFCSMALWAGYAFDLSGIEEFATCVESWTQAQRREFLESFYAARRQALGDALEDGLDISGLWEDGRDPVDDGKREVKPEDGQRVKNEVTFSDGLTVLGTIKSEGEVEDEDDDDEL